MLIAEFDSWWGHYKTLIEHSIGFSHDALHVLVGPCIQVATAAILRTSLRSPLPWFAVLILELANEAHDLRVERWPSWQMQWGESAKDLLLTLALPTLLFVIARVAPGILAPVPKASRKRK
ncbi:conserved hypothetical protein [Altererythrobacter sp. B11]|uniref:hypothetical protein n=1 Tax=Altererythrobacter sp. B11 TaxID=2060312 RepID=UPI000DC71517|nr:hypothetical protein [Altererythrobacter sp. B11]BBC73973.1 conserved hypothetical protein [Altererythrobacter sp. B11]